MSEAEDAWDLEILEEAVQEAAKGVVEFQSGNPFLSLRLLRLKAMGSDTDRAEAYARALRDLDIDPDEIYPRGRVVIGERVPAIRDNRDEWEKGPQR